MPGSQLTPPTSELALPEGSYSSVGRTRWKIRRSLIFPVILVVAFSIMSALGISGTSTGVIDSASGTGSVQTSLISGTPQAIRSDEWNVQTPLIVAQSHVDFNKAMAVGLGTHDLSVTYDIPTRDWSTFFKPWDLFPLFLNLEQGFAARWWAMSFLLIVGLYALILELTERLDLAIFLSIGFFLSPFIQWWYLDITLCSIGFGTFLLFFVLRAIKSDSVAKSFWYSVGAAYSAVGFTLIFYPPFQVPVSLVIAFLGASAIGSNASRNSTGWKRVGLVLLGVAGSASVVLAVFYLENRTAIKAISDTVYPGRRRISGGHTSILQLLSAPYGLALARQGLSALKTSNQSEISSFLLLGPFIILQVFRLRLSSFERRSKWLLVGATLSFSLLFLWYLVGLPSFLAEITLLNRVQPSRSLIGVGLAGILITAVYCGAQISPQPTKTGMTALRIPAKANMPDPLAIGAIFCGAISFVVYLWGGQLISGTFPGLDLGAHKLLLFSGLASLTIGLFAARKVFLGGIVFLLFAVTTGGFVNPFYVGLKPLSGSTLTSSLSSIANQGKGRPNQVWVSYAGANVDNPLEASGLATINAVQIYPDSGFWVSTMGNDSSSKVWNRYANVVYAPEPDGSKSSVSLLRQDAIIFAFDPCGSTSEKLHLGYFISEATMTNSCLSLKRAIHYQGQKYLIYIRN
jgi:hypothetical protein